MAFPQRMITPSSSLASEDLELIEGALHATDRSAELTRRLLAFSRRQPLNPQTVSVGSLLDGMMDLLRRTLGETIRVSLDPNASQYGY